MGLFGQTATEKKIEVLNRIIITSFQNVRNDYSKMSEWINYLYSLNQQLSNQNEQQLQMIQKLHQELNALPKTREDIKKIIDSYYAYDKVNERINVINERVEKLINTQTPILDNIDGIHHRIEEMQKKPTAEPKESLREKILKRITKNSKSYVKNLILSFIRKYNKMSALQLREMVVEEQGLCSKSSFYRILEEIEQQEADISVISDGKQKHYAFKLMRNNEQ